MIDFAGQTVGRFVFIASSAGPFGQPHSTHYAAAKAGIVGLMNVIAIEGAAHGIRANGVLPFGSSRIITETLGGEEVAAHLAEVSATEPFSVPASIFDEVAEICTRLGITG
jgi:NAD(P)-dependent dehydrogenase (short-subunit alcohol dehydrogenase family)